MSLAVIINQPDHHHDSYKCDNSAWKCDFVIQMDLTVPSETLKQDMSSASGQLNNAAQGQKVKVAMYKTGKLFMSGKENTSDEEVNNRPVVSVSLKNTNGSSHVSLVKPLQYTLPNPQVSQLQRKYPWEICTF